MPKSKILILLSLSVLLVTYQNCNGFKQNTLESVDGASVSEFSVLNQKAKSILTNRCVSCHSSTLASGGVDVTDVNALLYYRYIVPGEPQLSLLYNMIQEGQMPPGKPLSTDEAKTISDWIFACFNEATIGVAPTPATLNATYKSLAAQVFGPRCAACHGGANASAGINLQSYAGVKNVLTAGNPMASVVYTSVATRKTMPKGGGALTAAQVMALKTWIEMGALNN